MHYYIKSKAFMWTPLQTLGNFHIFYILILSKTNNLRRGGSFGPAQIQTLPDFWPSFSCSLLRFGFRGLRFVFFGQTHHSEFNYFDRSEAEIIIHKLYDYYLNKRRFQLINGKLLNWWELAQQSRPRGLCRWKWEKLYPSLYL